MPRHLFIALSLCLFGIGALGQTLEFSDNFDSGEGTGWVHYDPMAGLGAGGVGTWTYSDGLCRLQATGALAPSSTGPARLGLYCTNTFRDFTISADFVTWDNSLNQLFGVLARVTQPGLGTTAAYALAYATRSPGTGRFYLYRITAEAGTTLAQVDYTIEHGTQYRFIFAGVGGNLEGRVHQLFDGVPLIPASVALNAFDETYTSGHSGVFGYDNSSAASNPVDFTIDNFSASVKRPALAVAHGTDGNITVKWPLWATQYQLQSTDDLRNTSWDDVTWNLSQDAENFIFTELGGTTLFFRLVAP